MQSNEVTIFGMSQPKTLEIYDAHKAGKHPGKNLLQCLTDAYLLETGGHAPPARPAAKIHFYAVCPASASAAISSQRSEN